MIGYSAQITAPANPDVEIPIVNAQGRLRSAGESYLAIVSPDVSFLQTAIDYKAAGGSIELWRIDDGVPAGAIVTVGLDLVRMDEGARSGKLTLSGYATLNFRAPAATTIDDAVSAALGGSGSLVRIPVDWSIVPGDTVQYQSDSFDVGTIAFLISIEGGKPREYFDLTEVG